MRTLTLAVVGALIPAPALAQAATRRVYVDATAASGRAVLDLSRDDFEVTERGEAREVISAKLGQRPQRIVLIVDSTDAIRQPLGVVRKALTAFLEVVNPQLEMMLVSVAGTPQVRVRPTLDRQQLVKSADNIFGTSGSNVMHRVIDDVFHRFADTTDYRPAVFPRELMLPGEGFESTQNINLQEIAHVVDHFAARGGDSPRCEPSKASSPCIDEATERFVQPAPNRQRLHACSHIHQSHFSLWACCMPRKFARNQRCFKQIAESPPLRRRRVSGLPASQRGV